MQVKAWAERTKLETETGGMSQHHREQTSAALAVCLAPCWRLQERAGVSAGPILAGRPTPHLGGRSSRQERPFQDLPRAEVTRGSLLERPHPSCILQSRWEEGTWVLQGKRHLQTCGGEKTHLGTVRRALNVTIRRVRGPGHT